MKEIILTPIKVVESKVDSNFNAVYKFVQENFEALLIGAQRRSEHEKDTSIQPDTIIQKRVKFHFTRNTQCLVKVYYDDIEITSFRKDWVFNRVLEAIDSLRCYAENPDYYGNIQQSIIYDNREWKKAPKIEEVYDDSFFDDEI